MVTAAAKTRVSRQWRVAPPLSEELRLAFPDVHPLAMRILANRGVVEPDAVRAFLSPDFERDVHDPFLFRDMRRACERVWRAIETGERVVIHGDYDADGVTGSTVLMSAFRAVMALKGADPSKFVSYMPHREKEGYGVRNASVEMFAKDGATLMITVDCGIGCAAEISLAASLGIDTIIVDHHQIPSRIPDCITLHPLVEGETYPFRSLAAVGVAFKFACGFLSFARKKGLSIAAGTEKWLLDLVAIATVTDVVPLVGENRALEKYGLVVLNKTKRPGLMKLIESAGLELGKIDTTSVGFMIGPRINAASRMRHAEIAFACLAAENDEDASRFAAELEEANRDRQRVVETIMAEARREVAANPEQRVFCLAGEGWAAGVVGIVSGRISEERGVPSFVFSKEGEKYVGSGRSIEGFNLVKAMESGKEFLLRYGGHPQACGLTIEGDINFEGFRKAIAAYADETLAGRDLRPVLRIDAEIQASQMTWDLIERLADLEPFGEGNPKPRFALRDLLVASKDVIGQKGTTVRMSVRGDVAKEIKLIGFNAVELAEPFGSGSRIDAAVELGVNEWNGRREIQCRIVDLKPAGSQD